jgi:MSHA biogenesis protein MshO
LYRLASDISTAVPNSIRLSGTSGIEFLPTTNGGRYRATADSTGAGDVLDFTTADGSFDIIGSAINFAANDYIVLGSTQSDGAPPYDTTAVSGVLRAYAGPAGAHTNVAITATQFPAFAQLSSQRFDVVDGAQQAVTYACESLGTDVSGNGTGSLVRYWNYGFTHTLGATHALLADHVSACSLSYDPSNQRFGLLGIHLTLTSGGESVSLYHEIHVLNTP